MNETNIKPIVDGLWPAGITLLQVLNGDMLPKIAAAMAILWYLIRFYEYIKEKINGKSGS